LPERSRGCDLRTLSGEPIAREARDDAAPDKADQHQQGRNTEPVAEFRRAGDADGLCMNEKIGEQQRSECCGHRQVAPIPARHDFPPDDAEEGHRESQIEERCANGADRRR
jgi:hypothetical protein